MVIKNLCILVLWTEVASALESLRLYLLLSSGVNSFGGNVQYSGTTLISYLSIVKYPSVTSPCLFEMRNIHLCRPSEGANEKAIALEVAVIPARRGTHIRQSPSCLQNRGRLIVNG